MSGSHPTGSAATPGLVRIRIDLAYDGTGFRGFAIQARQRTVQGVLTDALSVVVGHPVTVTCAGRTDAGVHASAQVVHCDVPRDSRLLRDLARARVALDKLSGPEITVWRVRRVPASFDARFSATQRRYRYKLCDAEAMDPLWRIDTWHVGPPKLDVEQMNAAAHHLIGEHDFSAFCRRAGDQHLRRRIDQLTVRRSAGGLIAVRVDGKAFCHQMVRSVTGCLVRVGQGKRDADWAGEVLAGLDRQAVGLIAPAHGLTLIGVSYGS